MLMMEALSDLHGGRKMETLALGSKREKEIQKKIGFSSS